MNSSHAACSAVASTSHIHHVPMHAHTHCDHKVKIMMKRWHTSCRLACWWMHDENLLTTSCKFWSKSYLVVYCSIKITERIKWPFASCQDFALICFQRKELTAILFLFASCTVCIKTQSFHFIYVRQCTRSPDRIYILILKNTIWLG